VEIKVRLIKSRNLFFEIEKFYFFPFTPSFVSFRTRGGRGGGGERGERGKEKVECERRAILSLSFHIIFFLLFTYGGK
jgi:hypothetical protein